MAKLFEIIKKFEEIIPRQVQWEKDNSGLQIGDPEANIDKILLSLELTELVLREAVEKKVDLIFTHHPFIFKPLSKIDFSTLKGNLIKELILNNISLYSAHTNFDKYKNGVAKALALKIGLTDMKTLVPEEEIILKIQTFLPEEHIEKVAESLSLAGAGIIGEYRYCSFRSAGTGTFEGSEKTNPFIGASGIKESVSEIKLEMVFPKWKKNEVINALKHSHPYEEPAYDILELRNPDVNFGLGIIGNLAESIPIRKFLDELKKKLNLPFLRISKIADSSVKRIALLPGSGSLYIDYAIREKADIFITADINYHTFFEAPDDMVIIDAGHFETENPALDELKDILEKLFNKKISILQTENITNPIYYY